MMRFSFRHIFPVLLLVLTACSDQLLSDLGGYAADGEDGIVFTVSTEEQADIIYNMGQTRAAALATDTAFLSANDNPVYPLEGADDLGLYLHRMPLPLVGIHPRTVVPTAAGSTRATTDEIAGNGIYFHDSLTIWGYTSNDRTLFNKALLKKIRGWRSSVHWPYDKVLTGDDAGKEDPTSMRFYAVSPALESMEQLQLVTSPAYGTKPTFSYEVPADIYEQRDLLYGESTATPTSDNWGVVDIQAGPSTPDEETVYPGAATEKEEHLGLDDKVVGLKFRHILTAVRFAQGTMPEGVVIKKITLYHIKDKGTYDPSTNTWTPSGEATTSYDIDVNHTVTTWNAENTYIDGGNVLFLMPHTLTSAAEIHITLEYGGVERTLKTSAGALTGDVWSPGYTVTYKITVGELASDYYLLVGADHTPSTTGYDRTDFTGSRQTGDTGVHDHSTSQTTGSYTIHSYRNYKAINSVTGEMDNRYHAVGWQVTGFSSTQSGEYAAANVPNDWLVSVTGWQGITSTEDGSSAPQTPTSASGGLNQTLSYTITGQGATKTINHATILGSNTDVSGDLDLSTHKGGSSTTMARTTANCYIVNAKGFYSFPLVYGNAYENGGSLKTGENLNPGGIFKDHAGRAITNGRILEQVNYTVETDATVSPTEADSSSYITGSVTSITVKQTTKVLYNNSASDVTAEIIWQDISNLFKCTAISTTGDGAVLFNVGTGDVSIQPSNCVIALMGRKTIKTTRKIYDQDNKLLATNVEPADGTASSADPEILWTWHIWCTDEVYPNNNENSNYPTWNGTDMTVALQNENGTATGKKVLPVNLGWVPDNNVWGIYEPREVWVEVAQTEGAPQKIHLKIRQEAKQDFVTGTSTVYQWGRPTALPMVKTVDNTLRPIYEGETSTSISSALQVKSIDNAQEAITNPTYFVRSRDNSTKWNTGATQLWSSTSKTLYDPCPPGFQLPAGTDLNVFTKGGGTVTGNPDNLNYWNTIYHAQRQAGTFFYAKAHAAGAIPAGDRYGTMVYMPATGYWSCGVMDGTSIAGQYNGSADGYYWTGDAPDFTTNQGTNLYLAPYDGTVNYGATQNFTTAMPIRPVQK